MNMKTFNPIYWKLSTFNSKTASDNAHMNFHLNKGIKNSKIFIDLNVLIEKKLKL